MSKTVAIIGGGIGGLATACYLAQSDFKVTIYEKNDIVGGRAMYFTEKGFYFDMGPSWYWMPSIFEKFFADFGKKTSDYYQLEQLSPSYRVFFAENDVIDIPADKQQFFEIIEKIEVGSSKKLAKILDSGSHLLQIATERFLYKDYPSLAAMLIPELAIEGVKRGAFFSLDSLIKRNFKNAKLQKLVTWHSLFLGASPKNLPSLYSFILNVDFEMGTWFPKGGMYEIVKGISSLANELGVTIKTNTPISQIITENGSAKAIKTESGEVIPTDIVIGNADYHHIETSSLEAKDQTIPEERWDNKVISPSTLLFYIGIDRKLNNSLHHNYFFNLDTWEEHFASLFENKKWPEGIPSYYFHATSKTDSSTAPENGESLFVLVPVASGLEDSDAIREDLFNRIINHLEKLTNTDILNNIIVKRIISQRDQTQLYNAYLGNNFGLAQTLFQTGAFRPYNQSRKVSNLYYVGHYTHPGIGLPMVLISGFVTANLVKKNHEH